MRLDTPEPRDVKKFPENSQTIINTPLKFQVQISQTLREKTYLNLNF